MKRIWLLLADLTVLSAAGAAFGVLFFCLFLVKLIRGWLQ
jgi:hypothetical protein